MTLFILGVAWIGIAVGWCYLAIQMKRALCEACSTALNSAAEQMR